MKHVTCSRQHLVLALPHLSQFILLFAVLMSYNVGAQIVDIPDSNFLNALIEEGVDLNGDGIIQRDEARATEEINVSFEDIISLAGLSSFINILELNCSGNDIEQIDLTGLLKIEWVNCSYNELSKLIVSGRGRLEYLNCSNNDLTNLDLRGCPNLDRLNCSSNNLTQLDLTVAQKIRNLTCAYNQLTSIKIFSNKYLSEVQCWYNQLTALDLSGMTNLKFISCFNNNLESLNLSGSNNLESIKTYDNNLQQIDLADKIDLIELTIQNNNLQSLDLTGLSSLIEVRAESNELQSINLTGCINLQELTVQNNALASLDLTDANRLTKVAAFENQIASIIIPDQTQLNHLGLGGNQLKGIDLSNCPNLTSLSLPSNSLTDLSIKHLTKLTELRCGDNRLITLDVSGLSLVTTLSCQYNELTDLNTTNCARLSQLDCNDNKLSTIDLTGLAQLQFLRCQNNQLATIEFLPEHRRLYNVNCDSNKLETIYMKNGHYFNHDRVTFAGNPDLVFICADEPEVKYFTRYVDELNLTNCIVNTYCSFIPGGDHYQITIKNQIDWDRNGCDSSDTRPLPLQYDIFDGISTERLSSNNQDNLKVYLNRNDYTVTPVIAEYPGFLSTPTEINLSFPQDTINSNLNFCVTPIGIVNDLRITMIPLAAARPGFESRYRIIYENVGNTVRSGFIELQFESSVMQLDHSIPTYSSLLNNIVTWQYVDLYPFEKKKIELTFILNSPMDMPPLNRGDILNFKTIIFPIEDDISPRNNSNSWKQEIVNSFDPNDKTCLEGSSIVPADAGEFVHYMIRFENTGTAAAQNIVVKDIIDMNRFDVSSIAAVSSSHDYIMRISDENIVEFIFQDIQLPFEDATNDGFIVFKIKTLPTLSLGDTLHNEAEIYFDFNFPIVTEPSVISVQDPVSNTNEADSKIPQIKVFPNPFQDLLTIESDLPYDKIEITTTSGVRVKHLFYSSGTDQDLISVDGLVPGMYFMHIWHDDEEVIRKIIRQ